MSYNEINYDGKILRQVKKQIAMPKNIYIADPWYVEQYESGDIDKKQFNSLTFIKNFRGKNNWVASVSLTEKNYIYDDNVTIKTCEMDIHFAPDAEFLKIYQNNMKYKYQKMKTICIGVDSAKYDIGTEDRIVTIHTGADGYIGEVKKYFKGSKCEGISITLSSNDYEKWDRMQSNLEYIFNIKFD